MNKFIKLFLIFVIIINTTSCYDKIELEDRDFVLTIAIDKYIEEVKEENKNEEENQSLEGRENIIEEGLENNRFTITVSIPDPYSVVNREEKMDKTISGTGETITNAIVNLNKNSGTNLDFAQTKVVILGKSLLNDEALFKETLDTLERNKRLSRKVLVLATEHNAKDVLEAEVKDVKVLGYFLSNYYSSNKDATFSSNNQGLITLIQNLEETNDALLPLISINKDEVNLANALVIKDFKWKEIMFAENLNGYIFLKSDKHTPVFISTEYEDFFIPLKTTKRDITTHITEKKGKLIYNVTIDVDGTINEFSFKEESLLQKDLLVKLESSFNETIEMEILDTFYAFQNTFEIDGLKILDLFYKDNYELYQKYKDVDKDELLKLFEPNIIINTKISSVGSTN